MFDEEELMFDDFQNPPRPRKEKDIGKMRAYVRVVTSLGGSLNLELYCEKVNFPLMCPAFAHISHINRLRKLVTTG
jgi:peptidyl-prolyl cis-trans isomerase-like protein 2